MPLVPGQIKSQLAAFIKQQNAAKVEDADVAMNAFCQKIEDLVFQAIKSATVTVTAPPGNIAVQGTSAAQANIIPIQITGSLT